MNTFLLWFIAQVVLLGVGFDGYSSRNIVTDFGPLHYFEAEGQGSLPPVVLIHGIGSQATDLYPVMKLLRPYTKKIIALDLPAHGLSNIPVETMNFQETQDSFYQGLDLILSKEEPVLLFGNSLGGLEAILYANYNPAELAGLILVSPAGAQMNPEQYKRLENIFLVDSTQHPEKLLPLLFNTLPPNIELSAGLLQARFSGIRMQTFMSYLDADTMLQPEQISDLEMPILLIWGQQDRIFPGLLPFFKNNVPPQTQILEPENFTHSPYIEGSMDAELSALILNWGLHKL